MNCPDFEKLIALHVEGDLPGRKAAAVEEHLKACRACQEFAEKLKASQAMLKSLAQESVDEAAAQQFRRRVMNAVSAEVQPSPPLWQWRYALAAGLLATVVFAAVALWRPVHRPARGAGEHGKGASLPVPKETASNNFTSKTAKPPARRSIQTTRVKHVMPRRAHSRNSLSASAKTRQPAPLLVKLVTDDPHVVIYWLVD